MKPKTSVWLAAERALVALVMTATAWAGCNGTTIDGGSGETHFLAYCTDASCDEGLECVCGVCTVPCESSDACANLGAPASCVASTCSAADVCDVDCTRDRDCGSVGTGFTCEGGRCRESESNGGAGAGGKGTDAARDSGPAWIGAPCQQCDLQTQLDAYVVTNLEGGTMEDCGTVPVSDAGTSEATTCAHDAFDEGRPFVVVEYEQGTDSTVEAAWVSDGTRILVLHYDSNVCGGGGTCDVPGCGPRVTRWLCTDPSVPASPEGPFTAFDCADTVDRVILCGPLP